MTSCLSLQKIGIYLSRKRFATKMLCSDGILSLFCFIAAGLISFLPELLLRLQFDIYVIYFTNIWYLHITQYILINVLACLAFRGFAYQVSFLPRYCTLLYIKILYSSISFSYRWQSEHCFLDMYLELVF